MPWLIVMVTATSLPVRHISSAGAVCLYLKTEGIKDARAVTREVIVAYGECLAEQVDSGAMAVAYAQNLLSSVNVILETMRVIGNCGYRPPFWSGSVAMFVTLHRRVSTERGSTPRLQHSGIATRHGSLGSGTGPGSRSAISRGFVAGCTGGVITGHRVGTNQHHGRHQGRSWPGGRSLGTGLGIGTSDAGNRCTPSASLPQSDTCNNELPPMA